MKYRLKSDHSVTCEACDVGGSPEVEIPLAAFNASWELVPEPSAMMGSVVNPTPVVDVGLKFRGCSIYLASTGDKAKDGANIQYIQKNYTILFSERGLM